MIKQHRISNFTSWSLLGPCLLRIIFWRIIFWRRWRSSRFSNIPSPRFFWSLKLSVLNHYIVAFATQKYVASALSSKSGFLSLTKNADGLTTPARTAPTTPPHHHPTLLVNSTSSFGAVSTVEAGHSALEALLGHANLLKRNAQLEDQ